MSEIEEMDPRKVRKFDNWCMMHFNLFKSTSRQWNKSIIKVTIYFLKPMVLSSLKLHFTLTRTSTFSGFNMALLGVTTLLSTEKTRSDLDEPAGTRKTTLTSLARRKNWDLWLARCKKFFVWISASIFGLRVRLGKTRPHEIVFKFVDP